MSRSATLSQQKLFKLQFVYIFKYSNNDSVKYSKIENNKIIKIDKHGKSETKRQLTREIKTLAVRNQIQFIDGTCQSLTTKFKEETTPNTPP